uniref:Reverse transcriptase domain-containing protein n=1 Tax=Tanacetum cinerariifolium TaxID=118510 RepID=A0A6L2KJ20_TANCI|nr:reverse transcriptase domain-containing protein [Tanacetum cinerariifolium]
MRTCFSLNLVGESSPNPTSLNPKRRNRRRSKQPFILEESPVDTMADQRTMAELLCTPTEAYAEAIMVPPILAEHFEIKYSLINMMILDQFFRLEKDNPHDHIHLVSKFINELFPPSRTTNLHNEISNLQQWFDESFHEAWDRYKYLLHACPHHGFTKLHQLDTFYNALNPADQDSLNSVASGNMFERRTQHVLTIIENKSKVHNSRNKSIVSHVKSSDANSSSSSEIAKLTHAVNQQTSVVTTAMTVILKQFQATSPPASVKAVEEICITYGGAHPYYQCLAADGTLSWNFEIIFKDTFQQPRLTTIRKMLKALLSNKEKLLKLPNTPLNENCSAVILKKLLEKLGDPRKFIIPSGFSELKCKALADLGTSINLMPLLVWKNLGLPEHISTHMTLELANWAICTPAGIARDVFVLVRKFTFLANFVIVDYESNPRVPLILGRPFLWTARALIDVHGEKMILRDGDERLTLNMRHDTSSYSNQPQKESVNMINIYNDSYEDYLKDLFATNHLSGNPTFSSHINLTSPKVKDHIFDPEGDIEFVDELALITFPSRNYDLPFDIESDLREIEYLLNHDPTMEMDSILKDSIDESSLADPNNDLFDTIPEMFTNEHTLDYSSPPLYDDFDDDLVEFESDNDDVYNDPFDSKEDKIKESKLLIDELDLPRLSDFLPSPEYDSFLFEDFSEVDALPSTDNEDKGFDPPLYELPFYKEVLGSKTLLSFSSENEKKVFKPRILTSKGVHTSLLLELSHRGPKAFKVIKNFESPMEIFACSYGEDIHILDVSCLHLYPP